MDPQPVTTIKKNHYIFVTTDPISVILQTFVAFIWPHKIQAYFPKSVYNRHSQEIKL